ncbi:MAG: hypothetical protein JWO95_1294, partial [Verrucomicrobiales bacterium]|nr:hypothetical protein [Verrucomicrobiales bacterium]
MTRKHGLPGAKQTCSPDLAFPWFGFSTCAAYAWGQRRFLKSNAASGHSSPISGQSCVDSNQKPKQKSAHQNDYYHSDPTQFPFAPPRNSHTAQEQTNTVKKHLEKSWRCCSFSEKKSGYEANDKDGEGEKLEEPNHLKFCSFKL